MFRNSLHPGSCDAAADGYVGHRRPVRADANQASIESRAPSGGTGSRGIATPLEELPGADGRYDIRLDSCCEFERIIVRTRNSTYEIIVLAGDTGEVMVRGGEFFKQFRHATLAGSILGCTSVKLRTICAGCHLELRVDGKSFVTSRVTRVSRGQMAVVEGAAE